MGSKIALKDLQDIGVVNQTLDCVVPKVGHESHLLPRDRGSNENQ